MSGEQIQIFISYARDDDEQAPNIPNAMGFVEFLHRQMNHKFKTSGRERPEIWRDVDNIYRGEQFWPKIQQELDKSALLLVVLSENWMASDYCRKELDYFRACRQRRGEPVDERIIIVAKNDVDLKDRPEGMRNSEGYCFYRYTDRPRIGKIEEFFIRGFPVGNVYWPLFDELCIYLVNRSKQLRHEPFTTPEVPKNARTVFVAKPASDMLDEYIGVVKELTDHGYNVVPKRAEEMPRDRSALGFVDEALATADVSIHLIGESAGWEPEDLDKIVTLQLGRAAAKVEANGKATERPSFQRIIWAPKVFWRRVPSGDEPIERDPHAVIARFGGELPSDQVSGADPGNFRQTLIRQLDQLLPLVRMDDDARSGENITIPLGGRVFVLHHENDRPLARSLKKALWEHKVEALLSAIDGDPADRNALDKSNIQRSDAVVVCWGNTSETWTRTQVRQFEDWRAYQRNQRWAPRSILLAPPPGEIKNEFKDDPPPSEIDRVVVVQDISAIPPDVLREISPRRPAVQP